MLHAGVRQHARVKPQLRAGARGPNLPNDTGSTCLQLWGSSRYFPGTYWGQIWMFAKGRLAGRHVVQVVVVTAPRLEGFHRQAAAEGALSCSLHAQKGKMFLH